MSCSPVGVGEKGRVVSSCRPAKRKVLSPYRCQLKGESLVFVYVSVKGKVVVKRKSYLLIVVSEKGVSFLLVVVSERG